VTNNCTVFEFNRPRASKLHPTEKPVELVAAMIQNSSHRGDIVGESFSGSGTDLVASEQTARLCYAAELEPKYIAVALERLAGMGLEPRLTT
jgi:DNA modification methylase